jgi:hypothetical protein
VERELEEISSELCALAKEVDAGNITIKEALSYFRIVLKMKQEKSPTAVDDFMNITMVSGSASSTSATCHYEEQD